MTYLIRVRGHPGPDWADAFDGMAVTREADGTAQLSGSVVDEAALLGLLRRLRDLGVPLISVQAA